MQDSFLLHVNQLDSSYLVLLCVFAVALAACILFYTGLLGWVFRRFGWTLRASIRRGFLLWERLFAWVTWPGFLAIVVALLALGWLVGAPG